MIVSSKSRYATRALVELALCASAEAPVRVADLAARRKLPGQFLEQLFGALRRAGVLESHRGAGGGFTFAKPPDRVTVLEVVSALDGPPAERPDPAAAADAEDWAAAQLWQAAEQAFTSVLACTSIADLAEREREQLAGQPMYQI